MGKRTKWKNSVGVGGPWWQTPGADPTGTQVSYPTGTSEPGTPYPTQATPTPYVPSMSIPGSTSYPEFDPRKHIPGYAGIGDVAGDVGSWGTVDRGTGPTAPVTTGPRSGTSSSALLPAPKSWGAAEQDDLMWGRSINPPPQGADFDTGDRSAIPIPPTPTPDSKKGLIKVGYNESGFAVYAKPDDPGTVAYIDATDINPAVKQKASLVDAQIAEALASIARMGSAGSEQRPHPMQLQPDGKGRYLLFNPNTGSVQDSGIDPGNSYTTVQWRGNLMLVEMDPNGKPVGEPQVFMKGKPETKWVELDDGFYNISFDDDGNVVGGTDTPIVKKKQKPITLATGDGGFVMIDPETGEIIKEKKADPKITNTGYSLIIPQGMSMPNIQYQDPQMWKGWKVGRGQDAPPQDDMMGMMGGPGMMGGMGQPAPQPAPSENWGGWVPPVSPQSVEGIGNRFGQSVGMEGIHKGTDIQAVEGTPVVAPFDGRITNVQYDKSGLGLKVTIEDEITGEKVVLSHMSMENVDIGQEVKAGDPIGKVGSTGAGSTGPHLDVRDVGRGGEYLNPERKLPRGMMAMPLSPNTVGVGGDRRRGWGRRVGVGAQWTDEQGVAHNTDYAPYGDQGDTRYGEWGPGGFTPAGGGGGGEYRSGDGNSVSGWDEAAYLAANPDVAAAVKSGQISSGYEHYQQWGKNENRPGVPAAAPMADGSGQLMPGVWDEQAYLAANPDVAAAVRSGQISSGFDHYNAYGKSENRPGVPPPAQGTTTPLTGVTTPIQGATTPATPTTTQATPTTSQSSGTAARNDPVGPAPGSQPAPAPGTPAPAPVVGIDPGYKYGVDVGAETEKARLEAQYKMNQENIAQQRYAVDQQYQEAMKQIENQYKISQDQIAYQRDSQDLQLQYQRETRDLEVQQQQIQRDWQAAQTQLAQGYQTGERVGSQDYQAQQTELARQWQSGERRDAEAFQAYQAQQAQQWQTGERAGSQEYQAQQAELARQWQTGESRTQEAFQAYQADLARQWQTGENKSQEAFQASQSELARQSQQQLQTGQQTWQTGERAAGEQFQSQQAELSRQWQTGENRSQEAYQAYQADIARQWQTGENVAQRTWESEQTMAQLQFQAQEAELARQWQTGENRSQEAYQAYQNQLQQQWQTSERMGTQQYQSEEAELARQWQTAASSPWLDYMSGRTPKGTGWMQPQAPAPQQKVSAPPRGPAMSAQPMPAPRGSVGAQLSGAGAMPGQASKAPSAGPSYQEFASMDPYQKAAYRYDTELGGTPWGQTSLDLRKNWAQQGVNDIGNVTNLQAAGLNEEGLANQNMLAETFGYRPEDYWTKQQKSWGKAAATNVTQRA